MNKEYQFFRKVIALEHPRYIMQYKNKYKDEYIADYIRKFEE